MRRRLCISCLGTWTLVLLVAAMFMSPGDRNVVMSATSSQNGPADLTEFFQAMQGGGPFSYFFGGWDDEDDWDSHEAADPFDDVDRTHMCYDLLQMVSDEIAAGFMPRAQLRGLTSAQSITPSLATPRVDPGHSQFDRAQLDLEAHVTNGALLSEAVNELMVAIMWAVSQHDYGRAHRLIEDALELSERGLREARLARDAEALQLRYFVETMEALLGAVGLDLDQPRDLQQHVSDWQHQIRAHGFSPEEREAMIAAGMSASEIEAERAQIAAAHPADIVLSLISLRFAADAMERAPAHEEGVWHDLIVDLTDLGETLNHCASIF